MSSKDIPSWSLHVASSIMETVRVKDESTHSHCIRVSRASRLLAQAAGLSLYEQKLCEFAGLFHDIGKIGVPDEILLKPSSLTEAEYEIMKSHPAKSVQILKPLSHIDFYKQMLPGILHHHERFDGRGYPYGVKGDEIPLEARIILVCDTFDAMTADRAYRKGLAKEVAYKELADFAGRQFDDQLVKIFLQAQPLWKPSDYRVCDEMNETVLKTLPTQIPKAA